MNCSACKKHVNIVERIKCCSCKKIYHYLCLNITKKQYESNTQRYDISWQCPECMNITRRPKNDNTPTRSVHSPIANIDESYNSEIGDTPTSNLETTNMEQLSSLLDKKLGVMQQAIVTQLSNTIEEKILMTFNQFKQDFIHGYTNLKTTQKSLLSNVEEMGRKIQKLENEKEKLEEKLQKISDSVIRNPTSYNQKAHECETNKKFVLYGLNEECYEDEHYLNHRIIHIFRDLCDVDLTGYVEDIARMGKKGSRRPVMIELISKKMTSYILKNSINFKNTGLHVQKYLNENGRRERTQMQEILRNARKNGKHAIIRNNKLIIDGKEIKVHEPKISNVCPKEDLGNKNSIEEEENTFRD